MLYYSTDPTVITVCSKQEQNERKALRIANQYFLAPEIQAAHEDYLQERISLATLEERCDDYIYDALDLNRDNRAKKLHNLRNAVRKILVNMRYDYEDMRMNK